jgi:NADH pyrophosphatase NudC (nudix superfamily)
MEFLGGDPSLHDDEVEEARWFETDEAVRELSYPTERDIFGKALALLKK